MKTRFEAAKIVLSEAGPVKVSEDIQKQVLENTARNKLRKTVLNMDFLQLVSHMILHYSPESAIDYKTAKDINVQRDLNSAKDLPEALAAYSPVMESWKFFIQFALTVLLRVKEESSVPLYQVLKSLKNALSKDVGLSMWLVETFTSETVLEEFFLYCPSSSARFFVVSILLTACKVLYLAKEKEKMRKLFEVPELFQKSLSLGYYLKRGQLVNVGPGNKQIRLFARNHVPLVIILLNNVMRLIPILSRTCNVRFRDLCLFLTFAARIGPEIKKFLLNGGMVGFALEKLLGQTGPFTVALASSQLITSEKPELSLGTQKVFETTAGEPRIVAVQCRNKGRALRFLVDLLAEMLVECRIGLTTPAYTSKVKGLFPHEFPSEEGKFLARCFEEPGNWKKLFAAANSDMARESMARVFAHVCFNNGETSQKLMKFLCVRLIDAEIADLPCYVLALRTLMKTKDECEDEKWAFFVKLFREIMTQHVKDSYIAYNYMADLFLELAYDSRHLYQAIQDDVEKMAFVRRWLEYNTYPAPGYVYLLIYFARFIG